MFLKGSLNSAVGIQLELGVRSISDAQNTFRDYRLLHPFAVVCRDDLFQHVRNMRRRDGPANGWVLGVRPLPVSPAAVRRILGARLLELDANGLSGETGTKAGTETGTEKRSERYLIRHEPPLAAIVRKLVLSRRFYRAVHPGTLSHLLGVCFPRVQSLHLEPWRPVDAANLGAMERGYCTLLANLPPSVLHLNIFLESNYTIHGHSNGGFRPDAALTNCRPNPRPGRQLAQSSGNCVVINVAFLAEADDFFAAAVRLSGKTWPQLRTIILTSSTLTPASSPAEIEQLLLHAAAAVVRMPQLRQVELWFTRGPHACAFRVDGVSLLLKASWDVKSALTADVVCAWRALSQKWGYRSFKASFYLLKSLHVRYCMDARLDMFRSTSIVSSYMFKQSLEEMRGERASLWEKL